MTSYHQDEKDVDETASKPSSTCEVASTSPTSSVALPEPVLSELATPKTRTPLQKLFTIVTWMPKRCRWDPQNPPAFSMWLNVLFGAAASATVANLYYSHPILNILAHDFNVSNQTASHVPTLMQAGYAAGLFFLCPLGDLFKRRQYVLLLVCATATAWLGLCITKNFKVFLALSFITGFTTVTPQLMLPLVGELAPPHRRAMALSIVVSGNLLGMLVARLLSGVVTNFTSWRNVYWIAFGLQYLIGVLLWLFMPDYPSTNPGGLNYFGMLWSVLVMLKRHPVLVQACLVGYCTSTTFTSFWTTATFLLSSPPYNYSPLIIGLFALIGIGSMFIGPPFARIIIDRFVPLFSVVVGEFVCLFGVIVGTYSGKYTVVGPIIQAFFTDLGLQTSQTANRSAIYAVEPKARNRVNTAFMVSVFFGQLTGTAAGNDLYAKGGWIASGSLSVGMIVLALIFVALRGPWEEGWIGWGGGLSIRKKDPMSADGKTSGGENDLRVQQEAMVRVTGASDPEKAMGETAAVAEMKSSRTAEDSDVAEKQSS